MSSNKWLTKLTKDFGTLAQDMPKPADSVISLPSPSFNWAVGNGGIVKGKAVCLFGPESGGKSLLMQLIMAQIHQEDPEAIGILFDSEFAFNPEWFKKLGGDPGRLIVRQTNDPQKIFDYMSPEGEMYEMLQEGAPIRFVGLDSVKGVRYPKDIKKNTTDQTMGGGGASYLGPALKGVLPVIREFNITTILVQQVYEEMDQYKKMNNPWIVPDGRALKHFCDYMIQVEKLETKAGRIEEGSNIHGGAQQVGHIIRLKCKKNRVAAPYRTAQLTLKYENGIVDTENELFDLAKSLGLIYHPVNPDTGKVSNLMWKFGDHDPVKGEANMREAVVGNPQLQKEILAALGQVSEEAVNARNEQMSVDSIDIDLSDL
jgi:recombination protein RecA